MNAAGRENGASIPMYPSLRPFRKPARPANGCPEKDRSWTGFRLSTTTSEPFNAPLATQTLVRRQRGDHMAWLAEKSMPRTCFIVFESGASIARTVYTVATRARRARPIGATEGAVKQNTDGAGQKTRFPSNARLHRIPSNLFPSGFGLFDIPDRQVVNGPHLTVRWLQLPRT